MVQYKAALLISDAIKGTSRDTLFQELGLESLTGYGPVGFLSSAKLHRDPYHLIFKLTLIVIVKERM